MADRVQVVFDYTHPRGYVSEVRLQDGSRWKLTGECNLCGQCCESCPAPKLFRNEDDSCNRLKSEKRDGIPVKVCTEYWNRPMSCAIYPDDPHEPLHDKCGYQWEKVD